jgi:hypothetical protein
MINRVRKIERGSVFLGATNLAGMACLREGDGSKI